MIKRKTNIMNIKPDRLDETSRRGFLAGMMGLAAQGIVPGSVVGLLTKELNTPAAATGRLSTAAGLALFQVIKDQLNQYDGEDDDDYYQAWEDMAGDLGINQDEDTFRDLMDLYHRDPKAAAQRLIQHLEQVGIDPNTIKVQPRDDWRYEWRIENGQRLVRNQDGDLEWVSPGDPDYPASKRETSTSATQAAASAVGRSQATALTSAAVSRFRDLVQRVMSAGQTQQSPTKDMGRIEPVTPALPAPDRSAAEIMRDLQDRLDRSLTDQEREIVQHELMRR